MNRTTWLQRRSDVTVHQIGSSDWLAAKARISTEYQLHRLGGSCRACGCMKPSFAKSRSIASICWAAASTRHQAPGQQGRACADHMLDDKFAWNAICRILAAG